MLFYAEGPNQAPLGVIILEGANIDIIGCETNPKLVNKNLNIKKLHLFALHWRSQGQGLRKYTLGCEKTEDVDDWVNKIASSRYSFMRKTHIALKKQLDTLQNVPARPPLPEKRKSFEELHADLRKRIAEMCPELQIASRSESQTIDLDLDDPDSYENPQAIEEEQQAETAEVENVEPFDQNEKDYTEQREEAFQQDTEFQDQEEI